MPLLAAATFTRVHEPTITAHIRDVNRLPEQTELTDAWQRLLSDAAATSGSTPGTPAYHVEVLARTAKMPPEQIRTAAQAFGAPATPRSRSGAVRSLVDAWQARTRGEEG